MSETVSDFDSPWKEALDAYFEQFLALFFPEVHRGIDWSRGYESLEQELRQILRESEAGKRIVDKLARVWRSDGEEVWVIVHIEVQGGREAGFARRMYVCHYRIFDRFDRFPVNLAVLTDDSPSWRPSRFMDELWGCQLDFRFPTMKLLDYRERVAELETSQNPFASVVLAHLKTLETRRDDQQRHAWKTRLVRNLYERGFSREDVLQLFRFIDWMMVLPPELETQFRDDVSRLEEQKNMPYITSVERMGREAGLAEGLEKGRVEGRAEGAREELLAAIEDGLRRKFGDEGLARLAALRSVDNLDKLRHVLRLLISAQSLDEVPLPE